MLSVHVEPRLVKYNLKKEIEDGCHGPLTIFEGAPVAPALALLGGEVHRPQIPATTHEQI
jgi:hypothetical protein